jgi:GAF domain-containing protein
VPARTGTGPVAFSLPPELRSVGQARGRLEAAAREWGRSEQLIDDARVVLSELMSNGVLHARTDLQVVIYARGGGIRLEVRDANRAAPLPPLDLPRASSNLMDEPYLPHASYLEDQRLTVPTATGRGLAVVSALASAWGWYPEPGGGKVVWAELGTVGGAGASAGAGSADRAVYPVRPVRLIAAPLRLVKASADHFDDLARELQMASLAASAGAGAGSPGGAVATWEGALVVSELSGIAEHVKSRTARMREPLKRAMWEAARRGDRLLDVNLLADAGLPAVFEVFDTLMQKSAEASERGFLLTEGPDAEVVAWRRWLRRELEAQIAGKPPRVCPFPVAPLLQEGGGPARASLGAARGAALAKLVSMLGRVPPADARAGPDAGQAPEAVFGDALARAIEYVGARRALLSLVADDNETVVVGAHVGFSPDVVAYWRSTSLSADLPSSEAIRTGHTLFFRTMAELDERYPIFLSTPAESDPAIACVPLAAGGAAFGCLVLGFAQARDFSPGEVSFLEEIADEFARRISQRRNHLARRLSGERDQAVSRAVAALAAAGRDRVWSELVGSVVAHIADGAAVHAVAEDGTIEFVLAHHRDPERAAAAVELLQRQPRLEAGGDMLSECARTGQPAVLQLLSDEAISAGARDDQDLVLLRRVGLGSLAMVPVRAGRRVVGVLSFANSMGRFISDDDLGAAQRLADEAGEALAPGARLTPPGGSSDQDM